MSSTKFDGKENSHRRYNPLMDEYVLVCPHRLKRPWKGQQEDNESSSDDDDIQVNSLAPGGIRSNGMVNPMYKTTFVFNNDFPALVGDEFNLLEKEDDKEEDIENHLFKSKSASGECKVMCFHADSKQRISLMNIPDILKIIMTWIETQRELDKKWKYIQIFENKGIIMGCSNSHPHCQIWASSYIPNIVSRKNESMKKFSNLFNKNMLAEYLKKEILKKERIVFDSDKWVWIVPFWAVWPYETMLLPKRRVCSLCELNEDEIQDLAIIMKKLLTCYDNLFETSFPYTMGWHGAPNPREDYDHWYLHACYYPPLIRSKSIKKFMVGYEMLAMPQRDFTAEKAAEDLRNLAALHYKDG